MWLAEANPQELESVAVRAPYDAVLDPLATSTRAEIHRRRAATAPGEHRGGGDPLSAGAVGTSYRGGRLGEESFILDGLGVKNQLDAERRSGTSGPPDLLSEASLTTNGFSGAMARRSRGWSTW